MYKRKLFATPQPCITPVAAMKGTFFQLAVENTGTEGRFTAQAIATARDQGQSVSAHFVPWTSVITQELALCRVSAKVGQF
jgi:hypothetical protein